MPDHPDSILEQRRMPGGGFASPELAASEVPLSEAESKITSLYHCAMQWMDRADELERDLKDAKDWQASLEKEKQELTRQLDELKGDA